MLYFIVKLSGKINSQKENRKLFLKEYDIAKLKKCPRK